MSDAAPARLGRFEIQQELGRGAMGVVYKAHDAALDRTVAIKTILLSGDREERERYEARFMQEARAAGKLSHPAIITIYDVGREGDLAYIAMEMLQGVDLRQQLAQALPPPRAAVNIAMQVAEGLAYAHEHGVVHRDIKPANIMLLRGGRAKIMDFGIARLHTSDVKTQTGALLGTPKYMSPEQLAGRKLDHRSDIFSLGVMFYEMLVGRAPFTGADVSQLMHNIASAPHVAPTRIVSRLPGVFDLIVARALEKDPAARYQSAQEFVDDLESALTEIPASTAAPAKAAAATLPATPLEATVLTTGPQAPSVATDPGTARFCPLSQRFDSAKALQRLAQPSARDRTLLAAAPRLSLAGRVLRDPDLRLLAIAMLVAVAAAAAIVFK